MQSMLSLPNVPNVIMRALDDYEAQMVHYAHQQHQHEHHQHQHPHHNNWSPIPYPTYPKYNPIANMCPQMLLSHPGWTMHLFDYEKSRKVILKTINVLQEPIGRNSFSNLILGSNRLLIGLSSVDLWKIYKRKSVYL